MYPPKPSGLCAPGLAALALAAILATAGHARAARPLFGFFAPSPALDSGDFVANSAVLPSYYWSTSKFDRANAGAFGPYTPQPWAPGCCVTAPVDPPPDVCNPPGPPRVVPPDAPTRRE